MSELAKRTVFGSLFVIVIIGSILLNYWAFFAVMLVTVIIGSQEVSRLVAKENDRGLKIITIIVALLFFVLSIGMRKYTYAHTFQIMFLFVPLLVALFSKKYSFEKISVSCWTSMFFVAFPCAMMLNRYDEYYLIIVFCLIWINDIFAYLTGMAIGKHKLFERISPKKTIEGSLGGLVMTVVTAYLVNHYLLNFWSTWEVIGLAAVVVVFGSLGDLCESMMKRQAGVKDSGNVIPGHGGILDRFDATFLAVPYVFCYIMIIQYLRLI